MTTTLADYLGLTEAAAHLHIHHESLRRLIRQGKVPAVLFGGKYLVEQHALDQFKASYDPRPGRKPQRRLL
jgi:excisionase family DNA binding protein